jgi:hypothetical protein
MAKSVGSAAKSSSRLCFTFVSVTTPMAPRTPLPTKFAVAEKHTMSFLRCEDYTDCRGRQNIFDAAGRVALRITSSRPLEGAPGLALFETWDSTDA